VGLFCHKIGASAGGSAAPRAMLFRASSKGLLDPPISGRAFEQLRNFVLDVLKLVQP
jgi:hypothetical protein